MYKNVISDKNINKGRAEQEQSFCMLLKLDWYQFKLIVINQNVNCNAYGEH